MLLLQQSPSLRSWTSRALLAHFRRAFLFLAFCPDRSLQIDVARSQAKSSVSFSDAEDMSIAATSSTRTSEWNIRSASSLDRNSCTPSATVLKRLAEGSKNFTRAELRSTSSVEFSKEQTSLRVTTSSVSHRLKSFAKNVNSSSNCPMGSHRYRSRCSSLSDHAVPSSSSSQSSPSCSCTTVEQHTDDTHDKYLASFLSILPHTTSMIRVRLLRHHSSDPHCLQRAVIASDARARWITDWQSEELKMIRPVMPANRSLKITSLL